MKQADQLILRELEAIRSLVGISIVGDGFFTQGINFALEEQTDLSNWSGMLALAGNQVAGHPNKIIVQRYPPDRITTSHSLGSNIVRFLAFYLPKRRLISGLKWFTASPGATITPNGKNHVGLYRYDYGIDEITLRAVSADNTALWSTFATGTYGNADFLTPYLAPPGIYLGAMLASYTAGGPQNFGAYDVLSTTQLGGNGTLFVATNFRVVMQKTAQTELPASCLISQMTAVLANNFQTWAALY